LVHTRFVDGDFVYCQFNSSTGYFLRRWLYWLCDWSSCVYPWWTVSYRSCTTRKY